MLSGVTKGGGPDIWSSVLNLQPTNILEVKTSNFVLSGVTNMPPMLVRYPSPPHVGQEPPGPPFIWELWYWKNHTVNHCRCTPEKLCAPPLISRCFVTQLFMWWISLACWSHFVQNLVQVFPGWVVILVIIKCKIFWKLFGGLFLPLHTYQLNIAAFELAFNFAFFIVCCKAARHCLVHFSNYDCIGKSVSTNPGLPNCFLRFFWTFHLYFV